MFILSENYSINFEFTNKILWGGPIEEGYDQAILTNTQQEYMEMLTLR